MVEFTITGEELWNHMERAVEKVIQRLRKTVSVLEEAKVPYAVIGGHAVRAWVAQVDEATMRTTQDVSTLVRPTDLPAVIQNHDIRRATSPLHHRVRHVCRASRGLIGTLISFDPACLQQIRAYRAETETLLTFRMFNHDDRWGKQTRIEFIKVVASGFEQRQERLTETG